jgi:hypothetical protein
MFTRNPYLFVGTAAVALTLGACGGGGGVASMPAPAAAPTPAPPATAASITIFANPSAGQYAIAGASIAGPGGNLDTYTSASDRFGAVSSADQDQPQIRYNAGGYYEIEMPGAAWDRLIPYKGDVNPDPATNNYFQPQSVAQNYGYLVTSNTRNSGYSYSELAGWGSAAAGRWGWVAFGTPTVDGGVPVSGSATYSGVAEGSADIMTADGLYGGYDTAHLTGSVTLNFDFAKGTLGGSMALSLGDGMQPLDLGTFNFSQTVFSAGSTTYSGKFDTTAAGDNFFLGRFTGPHAEETIGAWALPFVFDKGGDFLKADNQTHQAFGAWIAKRP